MKLRKTVLLCILQLCVIATVLSCNHNTDRPEKNVPEVESTPDTPDTPQASNTSHDEKPHSAYPECPMPASLHFKPDELEKGVASIKSAIDKMAEKKERFSSCTSNKAMKSVLASVPINPSAVIADIGAGTGYFEMEILEQGIPFQKLFAVDINADSLELLQYALNKLGYPDKEKVLTIHSAMWDTKLPSKSVDLALLIRNHFYNGSEVDGMNCLKSLNSAMKPGGRVHIFDQALSYEGKDLEEKAKLLQKQTINAFHTAGFHHIKTESDLQDSDLIHMTFSIRAKTNG